MLSTRLKGQSKKQHIASDHNPQQLNRPVICVSCLEQCRSMRYVKPNVFVLLTLPLLFLFAMEFCICLSYPCFHLALYHFRQEGTNPF